MVETTSAVDGLHDWLAALESEDKFNGVVLIRRGADDVYFGAYGLASRRWSVPNHRSTRFDTASITKLFTAVRAMQLVDAGALALDASIHEYVDLTGTTISPDVTLRHVLTHTSGIADDADEEDDEDYAALWVDKPAYSIMETADFLPQFVHKEPRFAPGTGCRYCNVGFILAGLAIESVADGNFREQVVKHVFGPAGMDHSGFYDRRDPAPDVAEGWDPILAEDGTVSSWKQNIFSYPPIGSPDGGAQVTADDLVDFMQSLRSGKLLSPATTELFMSPQVKHHEGKTHAVWYGFGLEFVINNSDCSIATEEKEGINAGTSAMVVHFRDDDLDMVVLSNSEAGAWPVIKEIDRRITGADSV